MLPEPAAERTEFGHKGKEYDGWETRRRRDARARLGDRAARRARHRAPASSSTPRTSPATTRRGPRSTPPRSRATRSLDELAKADWQPLLPLTDLAGDKRNYFPVDSDRRVTHVRLHIHPDGGVARLRVHGTVLPDPRLVDAGRSTWPRWRTAAG